MLAVVTILVALLLVSWVAVAGPITVLRILRFGDTDIDDFSHYPGRELVASEHPFVFERTETGLQLPESALQPFGGHLNLEALLAEHDTIAFLAVHDDVVVLERYFQGHTEAALSQAFSMTKSLFSVRG